MEPAACILIGGNRLNFFPSCWMFKEELAGFSGNSRYIVLRIERKI